MGAQRERERETLEQRVGDLAQSASNEQRAEGNKMTWVVTDNKQRASRREQGGVIREKRTNKYQMTDTITPKEGKKRGERGKRGDSIRFTFTSSFLQNYINSWFKKYEPARLRFLGNSGRNHFQLSPTLAGKSPNLTRTLALFLGLCPTLSICLMDNDASLDRPASIKHQLKI